MGKTLEQLESIVSQLDEQVKQIKPGLGQAEIQVLVHEDVHKEVSRRTWNAAVLVAVMALLTYCGVKNEIDAAKKDAGFNKLLADAQRAADDAQHAREKAQRAATDAEACAAAASASRVKSVVPPGTIVAWPGDVPDKDEEWRAYWRVCNGGSADFNEDLWKVLSGRYGNPAMGSTPRPRTIVLPNFQGCFLRGLGGPAAELGMKQEYGTAPPQAAGTADEVKSAKFPATTDHKRLKPDESGSAGPTGHVHGSWDPETRPVNYAVNWIIRVK